MRLRDIPKIGELFRDPSAPVRPLLVLPPRDKNSLFGPQFPPVPTLDEAQEAGTRVRVLKVAGEEILQVEIVRQSVAQVLKQVTAVMGARAVIDPQLDAEQLTTRVLRGRSWDDMLRSFDPTVEMVKSAENTYFFAARPYRRSSVSFRLLPDGTYQRYDHFSRSREIPLPDGPFSVEPRADPGIDPHFSWPKNRGPLVPQPDWQKREFNGQEFYFLPAPVR